MKTTRVKTIAVFAGTVLFLGVLFLFAIHTYRFKQPQGDTEHRSIKIGNTTIVASIAQTPKQQEQGLSGTQYLSKNEGKLFIFSEPGDYGFWMKDMAYGLDIIWLDSKNKIVAITENVAPETYPTIYHAPTAVQSVLEVNAGFSTVHNVIVGQEIQIKK